MDPAVRIEIPVSAKEREDRLAKIPKLQELSAAGDFRAQQELAWELAEGKVIDADFGEASRLFESAAASGDENALLDLARFLQLRRVPNGLRMIREFARKGNFRAQFWLGQHYQDRRGRMNQLRAAVWFKRSQQNGSIGGRFAFLGQQVRLASIYAKPWLVVKTITIFLRYASRNGSDLEFESQLGHYLTQLKRR